MGLTSPYSRFLDDPSDTLLTIEKYINHFLNLDRLKKRKRTNSSNEEEQLESDESTDEEENLQDIEKKDKFLNDVLPVIAKSLLDKR